MTKKPKTTYHFLTLHKAHPSPTPLQNLHKLHHSSILTPQNHHKTTARTTQKLHNPLPSEKKRFSNHKKSHNRLSFNTITEKQMTKETIQPESETQKTIIKPFSAQARYAKQRKPSWTFLCSSKICETKKTFMNLSLFKQVMRNSKNLHDAFLFNRGMRKEVRSHICDRPRVIPYLSIRSQPPTLHQIYRVTKQLQTRSWTENPREKRKKRKPMHNVPKKKQNEKKKIKMTTCMLFSCLLNTTYKRKTYFFSFINGQQRPPKWPINLQNMPNGVAKHAKPRRDTCPIVTRKMPFRNAKHA